MRPKLNQGEMVQINYLINFSNFGQFRINSKILQLPTPNTGHYNQCQKDTNNLYMVHKFKVQNKHYAGIFWWALSCAQPITELHLLTIAIQPITKRVVFFRPEALVFSMSLRFFWYTTILSNFLDLKAFKGIWRL